MSELKKAVTKFIATVATLGLTTTGSAMTSLGSLPTSF